MGGAHAGARRRRVPPVLLFIGDDVPDSLRAYGVQVTYRPD